MTERVKKIYETIKEIEKTSNEKRELELFNQSAYHGMVYKWIKFLDKTIQKKTANLLGLLLNCPIQVSNLDLNLLIKIKLDQLIMTKLIPDMFGEDPNKKEKNLKTIFDVIDPYNQFVSIFGNQISEKISSFIDGTLGRKASTYEVVNIFLNNCNFFLTQDTITWNDSTIEFSEEEKMDILGILKSSDILKL